MPRIHLVRLHKSLDASGESFPLVDILHVFFILLWRLVNDGRVNAKNKVLLGSGVAYFIFPLDLLPEAFLGPLGYADDLVLSVFILNKILRDTDVEIIRQHWSGSEDVLATIQKVLNAADSLVGSDIVKKIKRIVK